MASLVIGAAGAAIGAGIGGTFLGVSSTAIGWAVGSALGSTLFGPGGQDVEGPRLSDLKVQSSAYGAPIPIIYGKARVSGNIIWAKPIRERKIEEDAGGKGGGGSTVTTYEYYGSFAVALCDNEIAGVRKIWADSKLIYNAGTDADLETIQASNRQADNITIYYGTETQEADSLIQSDKGAVNTQAYRGTAYIVFDDLLLEKYGNRIPNITAEVISAGTRSLRLIETQDIADSTASFNHKATYFDRSGYVTAWVGQWDNNYSNRNVIVYRHYSNGIIEVLSEFTLPNTGGYNPINTYSDQELCAFYGTSAFIQNRFRLYSESGQSVGRFAFYSDSTYFAGNAHVFIDEGYIYALHEDASSKITIQKSSIESGSLSQDLDEWRLLDVLNSSDDDLSLSAIALAVSAGLVYVLNSDESIDIINAENGNFIDTISLSPSPAILFTDLAASPEPVLRVDSGKLWIVGGRQIYSLDLDGSNLTYHGSPSTISTYNPSSDASSLHVSDGVFHQYASDTPGLSTHKYRTFAIDSLAAGSVTLSDIVSDLDERAGLDASDDDTTALTDTVEGYVVTRPMSARKAIEPLQRAFFFDACEKDNNLTYVKRGGSVVANIPEIDLGAGDYGQEVDLYSMTRQQDSELPAEVVVDYIDLNRSYQEGAQRAQRINSPQENVVKVSLPIAMTADYGKEIAHVLLYNAHTEREQFKLSLTGEYIDLNPTDVITFTADGDTRKARIEKVTYGDTLTLDCVAEDATVYDADSTAGDSGETEQSVGLEGPTKLYLMDIPLLRNQDNDAGLYIAASGYFSAWTGAGIFKSLDGGVSYSPVEDVLAASVMGRAETVLSDASHTTFDRSNSVTVSLTSGTLSSSTESGVIQGANFALLGSEVIQFVNATDNGDGTYTLDTLLRGRRGTDWATDSHAIGEQFCLLRENVLERVGAVVNTERYYKAVSFGTFLDEAVAQAKTNTGVSQKPFSVKYISHTRNGSDDIALSWTRRSRYIGTPLWDLPVFEESESYKIEVLSGSTVVNTYTSSSESYTYTAAQQTSDGFTPGDPIDFNIYQVGVVDGYGTEYEAA